MDKARWGLNRGLPRHVSSTGGKFVYDDDQETPNTQIATFDYGDAQITFDVRGLITPGEGDVRRGDHFVGNIFFGSEGYMTLDSFGFRVYKGVKRELAMDEKAGRGDVDLAHMENFLSACRSRNYKDLTADIETGVTSMALVHLANISYRVGRRLTVDPATMGVVGDPEAARLLTRPYRAPYVVPDTV